MQYGDLSNKAAPRIIIVFEDAVGYVPDEDIDKFDKLLSKKKYEAAAELIRPREIIMRKLLDLTWRKNINIHLVTWMGVEMSVQIEKWMDEAMVPVRSCIASTPEILARSLAYHPDIVAVYDPDPAHVLTYGSKGVLLRDPAQIGAML